MNAYRTYLLTSATLQTFVGVIVGGFVVSQSFDEVHRLYGGDVVACQRTVAKAHSASRTGECL